MRMDSCGKRIIALVLLMLMLLSALPTAGYAVNAAHGDVSISGSEILVTPESGYDLCTIRCRVSGTERYIGCGEWVETASGYRIALPTGSDADSVEATFFCTTVWDGCLDVSWYSASETVFYLSNPAQLAGLAAIVNGIYNAEISRDMIKGDPSCIVDYVSDSGSTGSYGLNKTTTTYHYGADNFNGKTVYLTCDLDMGGVCSSGVWSGAHNYMPVGGQYRMDIGSSDTRIDASFNGTFDGQGYTISNIYCDRHNNDELYGDGSSVGLIGRLGVHDNDPVSLRAYNPAVRNVVVTGYIYARRSVGGIVGKIGKSMVNNAVPAGTGVTIENCANYATIIGTDAKGTAGIVGAGWNGGVVRNCYNAGSVTSSYGGPCGGIVGYNEISIMNCYNIGVVSNTAAARYAQAIGSDNGGAYLLQNNYYLRGSAANGGYYNPPSGMESACEEVEAGAMRSPAFVELLNGSGRAFVYDSNGVNGGFPVLRCTLHTGADTVTDFAVETEPKTEYLVGEAVDMGDFVLYAKYSDGSRERVDDYTVTIAGQSSDYANASTDTPLTLTAESLNEDGQVEMTVSGSHDGTDFSYTYLLTVDTDITPTALTVSGLSRLTYVDGELPNLTGVTVQLSYVSKTSGGVGSQTLVDYMVAGDAENADGTLAVGAEKLVFSYTLDGVTVTTEMTIRVLAEMPETDGGVYLLNSADDLLWFAAYVNEQGQIRSDARMTADIDMTGVAYTPIGISTKSCYAGCFDGSGHTLTLDSFQSVSFGSQSSSLAVFGCTKNAVISDLTVAGTITGSTRLAAIVALDTGYTTVTDCVSRAAVTASGVSGYAGGIAASVTGSGSLYENCRNAGTILASGSTGYGTGGIVGHMDSQASVTLENCVNTGSISVSGSSVGGIVGILQGASSMTGCENSGSVTAGGYAGGIVGRVADTASSTIRQCVNRGTIAVSGSAVGGVVGSGVSGARFSLYSCSNSAAVTGTYAVGGIAGQYAPSIYYCYNTGVVTGTGTSSKTGVGGILGNNALSAYVWYCYNAGTVTAEKSYNAGALAGYTTNYIVFTGDCYLKGTASSAVNAYAEGYVSSAPTSGVERAYLQSAECVAYLNASGASRIYSVDTDGVNGGYPVFRYTLSGEDAEVTGITLSAEPQKLAYVEGEVFDDTGLVITANYSDGTCEQVTDYETDLTEPLTQGNDRIIISGEYGGVPFQFTLDITVVAAEIQMLRVAREPQRTIYAAGESFLSDGMELELVYNNGEVSSVAVEDCVIMPSGALSSNVKWITVTFTKNGVEYEATVDVSVCACALPQKDESGVYAVSDADELRLFSAMVNQRGMTDMKGVLTADIDLSDTAFLPIGTADAPYTGTFCGAGHTVSLKLTGGKNACGLFGTVGHGAVLDEICVDGIVSGGENVGAVAGYAAGAEIRNCVSAASVCGAASVGGIIGNAVDCKLTACRNEGTVTVSGTQLGGVVGVASAVVFTDCVNTAAIAAFGKTYVGGIAGRAYTCKFNGCENSGELLAGSHSGGIVGQTEYGAEVTNCDNTAPVTAKRFEGVGGIVGYIYDGGNRSAELTNCLNTGSVSGGHYVGGIVGYGAAVTAMDACGSSGTVTATGTGAGGLAGLAGGSICKCFNTGDVTGFSDVGGLAGVCASALVEDCYSLGTLTATGDSSAVGTGIGGLLGTLNASETAVRNCYAAAALSAGKSVPAGALIGYVYSNLALENVYSADGDIGEIFGQASVSGTSVALTAVDAMNLGLSYMPDAGANDGWPMLCCQTGHIHAFAEQADGSSLCLCGYCIEAEISMVFGDVSGDESVSRMDAAMTYAFVNGALNFTSAQLTAADVNGDGDVTRIDAAMIYAFVNGVLPVFPAES